MGTSFVSIGEKGFWMQDRILELWLRLLALHIEESPSEQFIGRTIRDKWLLGSKGFFSGWIDTALEDAVSTCEGREVVLRAIHALMESLGKGAQTLHSGTLNVLGMESRAFTEDVEAARLREVGHAFLDLIAGKIDADARSTDFMPGSNQFPVN